MCVATESKYNDQSCSLMRRRHHSFTPIVYVLLLCLSLLLLVGPLPQFRRRAGGSAAADERARWRREDRVTTTVSGQGGLTLATTSPDYDQQRGVSNDDDDDDRHVTTAAAVNNSTSPVTVSDLHRTAVVNCCSINQGNERNELLIRVKQIFDVLGYFEDGADVFQLWLCRYCRRLEGINLSKKNKRGEFPTYSLRCRNKSSQTWD